MNERTRLRQKMPALSEAADKLRAAGFTVKLTHARMSDGEEVGRLDDERPDPAIYELDLMRPTIMEAGFGQRVVKVKRL